MNIYLKLAWRNIFRNKRRTYITGTAIAVGLAALIFIDASYIGEANAMIASATASFSGEGQIHRRGFLQTQDTDKTISDPETVVASLKFDTQVKMFTLRSLCQAMITSASGVSPVRLVGILPETEKEISQVDDVIVQGGYFDRNDPQNIVIGDMLAEALDVGIGDRVLVTAYQARGGNLSQDLFRVSGIFRFRTKDLDGGLALIRLSKAQAMLGLENRVHEIALSFKDPRVSRDEGNDFWRRYSSSGNEALGWTRLYPALKSLTDLALLGILIVGIIFFAVIALGIVNTLFMSIYERTFEFGVLRAVGTNPFHLRKLVVLEAGALALVSAVFGAVLGLAVTWIVSRIGLDYRGVEFGGVTMRDLIYPVLQVRQFIIYPLCVILFALLVSLYPAAYAARMSVTGAMKRTL
jgi:ABC-type lipoprotein release transport system permease subunit